MPRHSRVFTPTTIEIIRGLVGQGKSVSEIADAIGSTAASVRVRCWQLKIKISRRERGRPRLLRTQPDHVRGEMLIVCMPPAAYAALNGPLRIVDVNIQLFMKELRERSVAE